MLENKFWRNVRLGTEDACWRWVGYIDDVGYGRACVKGKVMRAHRAAFLIANGYLPTTGVIRHLCGKKVCVNPNHLAHGSYKDNSQDAVRHGSFKHIAKYRSRCEKHHSAVLTNQEVAAARDMADSGLRTSEIARSLGRKYTTVWAVIYGPNFSTLPKRTINNGADKEAIRR